MRHGLQRIFRDREDDGANRHGQSDTRQQRIEPMLGAEHPLHPSGQHDERKEANDHRGDPRQKLDGRFDDLALPLAGELGAIDRCGNAEGRGDEQRHQGHFE